MNKKMNFLFSVLFLAGCGSNHVNYVGSVPKNTIKVHLGLDTCKTIAQSASKDLVPFLSETTENSTCSPASYALALGGVVSASVNGQTFAQNCGFSDAYEDEFVHLLNGMNWMEEDNSLRSAVLYQQIGPSLAFDDAKREAMAKKYISSMVSSHDSYRDDAQQFFKNEIDLDLKIPALPLNGYDAIATYGALKLVDSFAIDADEKKNDFYLDSGEKISVNSLPLMGYEMKYYETEDYASLSKTISNTSVFFILPKDGVELETIDPYQAYLDYKENAETVKATGYLPYFHVRNQIDISKPVTQKDTDGKIQLFKKLLKDDQEHNIDISGGLQVNDFEFSPHGVKGESVTVIYATESCSFVPEEMKEITFNVDKPFYAISIYEDFPLFISKISNPNT